MDGATAVELVVQPCQGQGFGASLFHRALLALEPAMANEWEVCGADDPVVAQALVGKLAPVRLVKTARLTSS